MHCRIRVNGELQAQWASCHAWDDGENAWDPNNTEVTMVMEPQPLATPWPDEQPSAEDISRAQLTSIARQTPINAFATGLVVVFTGVILWPVTPHHWVALWIGLHLLLTLTMFVRWYGHRGRQSRRPPGRTGARGVRRAKRWALASGLLWGSTAAFLPMIPTAQQLAVLIVVASMASGGSTTLAAVPQAATLYILSSILPVAVYFVCQMQLVYFCLAAMAVVLTTAMLLSTRVVYGALLEEVRTKQANAALLVQFHAERQEWLDMSETAEAFALFDAQDRLLLWNENFRRLFALDPAHLFRGAERLTLLHQCAHFVDGEGDHAVLGGWLAAQQRLDEQPDMPLIQRLNTGRWLRSRARPTASGRLITMHLDITELKQAEDERERLTAQLHGAQKMEALGTLAGGIAHEFNNVLAIIVGLADLTQYTAPPDSKTWRNMQRIQAAGQRAKDLVQQILTFSRRTDADRVPVPFHCVIREVVQLLQVSLPSTLTIRHNCAHDVGSILADTTQMHQVVMNLCTNAEYAMRETFGVLEIWLDAVEVDTHGAADHVHVSPGRYVRLTVRDSGQGISPDVMTRIFEPFYTTKDVGQGTGMGLAIVHGIILDHGGDVTVESTPGMGTTFRVLFPRLDHPAPTPVPAPVPLPRGNSRILFVDDEVELVRITQNMLQLLGYEVDAVSNSREALRRFQAMPDAFDLVITDQTMPDLTGAELTQALRHIRPDIPVILCTGFSHVMDAVKAQALGIDAFLQKPLDLKALAGAIEQVCSMRNT
ncbi:MAG: response regulator [Candidatus Tectomicrobia bacterium]